MKREGLRRRLALAIIEILANHAFSVPNVQRYVVPILSQYRICRTTVVTNQDVERALIMAQNAIRGKPIPFRYAPRGSVMGQQRTEYMLTAPIIELVRSQ